MIDNLKKIFSSSIKVFNTTIDNTAAVWPMNVDICITRIPIRVKDGFSIEKMKFLAEKLKNSMSKDGVVFLVCYSPIEDKTRTSDIAVIMREAKFTHVDNIIIQKSWLPGKRNEYNLVNAYDTVLYFCNGRVWGLDRQPIKDYLGLDEDQSCCGNLWKVETGTLEDSYPPILSELLIRMTRVLPGSLIFDPFMGTKSSLYSAIKLGHSFCGFETDKSKFNSYKKLLEK
jgi:DNA modification methylase